MTRQKIYVSQEERTIKRRVIAMEVDNDFVQVYKNLLDYMVTMKSPWSFKYTIYLISRMNGDNQVDVGVKSMRDFCSILQERGVDIPTERTMKSTVQELVNLKLLIRLNKGQYKINPALFWQAGMKEMIS